MTDKFTQLVADLKSGAIGVTHIQNALREHYRRSSAIPDEAKDIVCGQGEGNAGLIFDHFQLLRATIGSLELAVRRAKDE